MLFIHNLPFAGGIGGTKISETFDICAGGMICIQRGSIRRDRDRHRSGIGAVCRDDETIGRGSLPTEQEIRVISGECAVVIHLPGRKIQHTAVIHAGKIVQQSLCVGSVCIAVPIHVVAGGHDTAVTVGDVPVQCGCSAGHVLLSILFLDALCEEVGGKRVFDILIRQVVSREGILIGSGAGGFVAEFRLDLAVRGSSCICRKGIAADEYRHPGFHGVLNICEAGALLQDRHVIPVVLHGCRRRHEQALVNRTCIVRRCQSSVRGKILFPQELTDNGSQTSHMRCGHGGAGHRFILIRSAGVRAAFRPMCACHGIDVSAGSCDLRLHQKGSGDTPGTEIGDFGVLSGTEIISGNIAVDLNRSGVIGVAAGGVCYSA